MIKDSQSKIQNRKSKIQMAPLFFTIIL